MGIEAAGGGYHNTPWPFGGIENAVNNWREQRAQFHQANLLQNQQHAFEMHKMAVSHEYGKENLLRQAMHQAVLNDQTHGHAMQQMDKKYGQDKGLALQSHGFATERADQDSNNAIARVRAQGTVDRRMERLKHKNAFGNRPSQFDALMEAANNKNVGNINVGGASLSTRAPQPPVGETPVDSEGPKPKRSRKTAPPQA